MKTNFKVVVLVICISFFSISSFATNTVENPIIEDVTIVNVQKNTVKGVYKGHDASGYIFSVVDEYGSESKMVFEKVDDAVLKANDLKSKSLIEETFEITFEKTMAEQLDSSGEVVSTEIKTIKGLKASR